MTVSGIVVFIRHEKPSGQVKSWLLNFIYGWLLVQ
jgi:hypothetical protein